MSQLKFSLGDVFTVLGVMCFGYFTFLSFNFLSLGDTSLSIILSVVFAFLLGGLAYGAKSVKRTKRNFKTSIIVEGILVLLFVIIALPFVFVFTHSLSISSHKEEIQTKIVSQITQAENLFSEYEKYAEGRLYIYNSQLQSVVAAKYVNPGMYDKFGFQAGVDDNTQIDNKLFVLKSQLYPTNYDEMKLKDSIWLVKAKNIVIKWKPIGVVHVLNEIENNLTIWQSQLITFSNYRAEGENSNDFEFPLAFENVSEPFVNIAEPTMGSIIVAILCYLIMLFSYFITKRDSKYPGIKVIFGIDKKSEINEL